MPLFDRGGTRSGSRNLLAGSRPSVRAIVCVLWLGVAMGVFGQDADPTVLLVLGRPTHESITISARANQALEVFFEYGREAGRYEAATAPATVRPDESLQCRLDGLTADTRYYYRARYRRAESSGDYRSSAEATFHTQRSPGATFLFAAQGDSHPERERTMFSPDLYRRTLDAVAAERPDFYLTSGDDFSVDTLPVRTEATVAGRYELQLPFLARVAHSSPLFLVNGNHEQAARYLLDGTPDNVAVWAQNARNRLFPQPGPDAFYSGNPEVLPHIGLLRNYYAWEWGDALFVVIDPYWASPVPVDGVLGNAGPKTEDKWAITHGDEQYAWLKRTLEGSRARWKFVFAHHVMGFGRGGVEVAADYEWGGRNRNGTTGFPEHRPGWPIPIHQLFVATGVTIFFQGHDHLFAHQQLDGVTYQELPNPADDTYTAFNEDAYRTGETFPNSGYVRVTVTPDAVLVEYVRVFLPADEREPDRVSGRVQFAYSVTSRS